MENNFTPEIIEKAKQAKSAEELMALAKENGIGITEEQAAEYFERLNRSGELSDDELDSVAGGGCYYDDGRLVVIMRYLCKRWTCKECGGGVAEYSAKRRNHICSAHGNRSYINLGCSDCAMKTNKGVRMLCNHPLNYKR